MFKLAPNLVLPATAPTDTFAFLGTRGAGKTYLAMKVAELLHDGGVQVVAVDPVGVWWGLRLAADGVGRGLSLPVFGGLHGDLPLEPTAGALCAQLVAEQRLSVVLDVSAFPSDAAWRRFVRDFARELFHLKQRNKSPVHVFFEEAHEFLPQVVDAGAAETVGAVKRLWKLGRNVGIGGSLVSQRAAEVNKGALNLTETLFTGKLKGPQDRKAIAGWAAENDGDEKAIASLPKLRNGQILAWLEGEIREIRCYPKRTFDSSKTPEAGDIAPSESLPSIDLAQVRAAMAATIEEAKANDPKELRAENARLRAEIGAARDGGTVDERDDLRLRLADAEQWIKQHEDDLLPLQEDTADVECLIARLESTFEDFTGHGVNLTSRRRAARAGQPAPVDGPGKVFGANGTQIGTTRPVYTPPPPSRAPVPAAPEPRAGVAASGAGVGKAARLILEALAARHPTPLSKIQVATLAGYAPNGGGFNNALGELKGKGYVERDGETWGLTAEGAKACPPGTARPRRPQELVDFWCSKLTGRAQDMLRLLARAGRPLTKEEIAKDVGMDPTGGGFNNYMGTLRSNALIQKTKGGFEAASSLVIR